MKSSGATEHCLKCHGQFHWLHPKTLSREARYKSRKIRERSKLRDRDVTVVNRI